MFPANNSGLQSGANKVTADRYMVSLVSSHTGITVIFSVPYRDWYDTGYLVTRTSPGTHLYIDLIIRQCREVSFYVCKQLHRPRYVRFLIPYLKSHHHHHHHLPPWIRSFDLFRHRRVAIVSWGVRDPFFPGFVGEGVFRESGVVHFSRWLIQFCLHLSLTSCIPEISTSCLMSSFLILSSLVYPVTLLRKRISAASRRVMSLFVVTHVLLPQSKQKIHIKSPIYVNISVEVSLPRHATVHCSTNNSSLHYITNQK
jgi:hypothetical protein